ncbi:MAG: hypothetical protein WC375_03275 [Methanomassiliicoccales archaeon]|jgi:hypothetical protein
MSEVEFSMDVIREEPLDGEPLPTTWRSLLLLLISHVPTIKRIGTCNKDGDLTFAVSMENVGLSAPSVFMKYRPILFSSYIANVLGELIVRENLDKLVPVLTGLKGEEYLDVVNKYEHNKFGMHIDKSDLVFSFHISLLQNILTEDFKRKVASKA